MAYVERPLSFKSGSWDIVDVASASTEEQVGLPGSIAVALTQMSNINRATMGGMLVARDSEGHKVLFGLTVGHLLHQENTTDTYALNIDSDAVPKSPSKSNVTTGTADNVVGRLAKVSFSAQARNLDWALIQLREGTSIAGFLLSQPPAYSRYEKFVLGQCSGVVGYCRGAVTFQPDLHLPGGAKVSNHPARVVTPQGKSFIKVYPINTVLDS